jgi:hypothetical protein
MQTLKETQETCLKYLKEFLEKYPDENFPNREFNFLTRYGVITIILAEELWLEPQVLFSANQGPVFGVEENSIESLWSNWVVEA